MWLRSFERFFRIGAQPLSARETRALGLRNWSEELRLVDHALMRVVQLSAAILTEEQADLSRFDRYVESSLSEERPRPLHREARPPHDAGGGPHPAAGVLRGPAPPPPRPREALPAALRDLPGGGEDRLPGGPAQRPRGHGHRQEVQARPRPHPKPAGGPHHPRDPGPAGAAAGGQGVPGALPAPALPRVHRPVAAARGAAAGHDPPLRPRRLRDAAAALVHREEGAEGPGHAGSRSTRCTTRSCTACPSSSRRWSTPSSPTSRSPARRRTSARASRTRTAS